MKMKIRQLVEVAVLIILCLVINAIFTQYVFLWTLLFIPAFLMILYFPNWKVAIIFPLVLCGFKYLTVYLANDFSIPELNELIYSSATNYTIYLIVAYFRIKDDKLVKALKEREENYKTIFVENNEFQKNLQEKEKELINMAYYDLLTGLPNRRFFQELLDKEIKNAARRNNQIALLFVDLDKFKKVNDDLGHDAGDSMLKEVANRLSHSIREVDTVARLAGDEYSVILPEVTKDNVIEVLKRILIAMKPPVHIQNNKLEIKLSIGIAMYPMDGKEGDTLLRNADTAMYQAKKNNKNSYAFYHHS